MQFYAIEIARNRNGLNDWIYENYQKEQAEAKAKDAKSWWMDCTTTTILVHIQQAVEWLRIATSRRVEDPSIAATPWRGPLDNLSAISLTRSTGTELLNLRIWTLTKKIFQWQNRISNIFRSRSKAFCWSVSQACPWKFDRIWEFYTYLIFYVVELQYRYGSLILFLFLTPSSSQCFL